MVMRFLIDPISRTCVVQEIHNSHGQQIWANCIILPFGNYDPFAMVSAFDFRSFLYFKQSKPCVKFQGILNCGEMKRIWLPIHQLCCLFALPLLSKFKYWPIESIQMGSFQVLNGVVWWRSKYLIINTSESQFFIPWSRNLCGILFNP